MSISTTDILAFVNKALGGRSESLADITPALRKALKLISMSGRFLEATDDDQTLALSEYQLDYPTDFGFLKDLYIYKATDTEPLSLAKLVGPYPPNVTNGLPTKYRRYNGKIEVLPPADGDYLARIEYGRLHPSSITTILFSDEFESAINHLTTANRAADYEMDLHISRHIGFYNAELKLLKKLEKSEVKVIRYWGI